MAIDIKGVGRLLGRGVATPFAPAIMGGTLVSLFKRWKLDVEKTTVWVLENKSLWDHMGEERQQQMKKLVQKVGSLDWMNAEWAIKSLKAEFPAVASLFLGWPKAYNWLERQLEMIKKQAGQ